IMPPVAYPCSRNISAHCSMLTGTYPPYHGVHRNREYQLSDSQITLAEILREQGYATGGIISSFTLDKMFGTDQGFDIYHDRFGGAAGSDNNLERRGVEASRLACDYLAEHQDEDFFLFLHYFDPHEIYQPPAPFADEYADDLYAGEIAYTDQCVGQVIEQLKKLDLFDSTLIIIVGDHGESRGEHGESTHGYYIYQSTIHIPFIIRAPGIAQPRVIKKTVSLVDVIPTVLSYLDIPIPEPVQGQDLSGYLQGENPLPDGRDVYVETLIPIQYDCNPLQGMVGARWSYIHSKAPELYNLEQDPAQLNNLAAQEPQQVRLMSGHLQEIVSQQGKNESSDNHLRLDADNLRRLESLGYVGKSITNDTLDLDPSKKDAKEMIQYHEYSQAATMSFNKGEYAQARTVCLKIIERWPDDSTGPCSLLMKIAFKTNNPAEVIKYGQLYFKLVEAEPANGEAETAAKIEKLTYYYSMMVQSAIILEMNDMAVEYSIKSLKLNPNNPDIINNSALAYFRQGNHDKAFELWHQVLRIKPEAAEVYGDLGMAYYQTGDLDKATKNLNQALQLQPDMTVARKILQAISKSTQLDPLVDQYTKELQDNPNDPVVHNQLAQVYFQKCLYELAIKNWRQALQFKPDWPEVHNNMGQAFFMLRQLDKAQEHWRRAIQLKPDWPEACKNLAWLLATSPEPELLRPAEALELALRAAELSQYENTSVLETLSVAYAVNNKIDEAISTAQKAIELATTTGNLTLAEKFRNYIQKLREKRDG
ncbi:tetratricopeptide repeat protein, partial [Planctomycetota bacterium]